MRPKSPSVELKQRLDRGDKLKIVDVREPNEYQINRIRGSELIPLGDVPKRYSELDPRTRSWCSARWAAERQSGRFPAIVGFNGC
jgi:rhodanese-related sulfurtransferase